MLDKIRQFGWIAVEIGVILVALAILLSIILGDQGGGVVTSISGNAIAFLKAVPSGTIIGFVLIAGLYALFRSRFKS